ncbi:hypothetical protein QA648_35235 (plasmid) [Rhizobium sp. CB3171]|uniref:hypothetical protein n=1 Tax=Rhizobium sp. CB3171 TaxID=3039157 RepID=UPI0024B0E0DA|nr:hypothetical protein [Rhizobium sp. CB3171]WFU07162.1 hypothetical protein QA648_35235 [Rhizobium sp. CB3171]
MVDEDCTVRNTIPRKIYRRLRNLPSELALWVINLPAIEARLRTSYKQARIGHLARLPKLSDQDAEIVEGLNRDGVYVTTLASLGLPLNSEMFASARLIAKTYEQRVRQNAYHGWETIMATPDEITSNPSIFLWGLNQRLLNIVEAYLGLPVAYDGLNLFYTVADGRQIGTRKWHRDREDRRMIKIAVYCNDVDEGGGPLEVVRPNVITGDLADKFTYPILSQESLEARLGGPVTDRDIVTCTGPAGTVIFSDTASLYHRGKPAISRDRCAIYYNYFSRRPRHPFFCERSGLSRAQIAELSHALAPEQRSCVSWRDNLPRVARLIPRNVA